ncbi:MAG: hypothetical protein DMD81_15600, partial [Candidatus Rokuibacteriota bacterium]
EVQQRPAITLEFCRRFAIRKVLSVSVRAEHVRGRLFFLDTGEPTRETLGLALIAADELADRLDQQYFQERLRESAVAAERVRLARDLHDGVLQFLTGTALQLRTAVGMLADGPHHVATRLGDVERMVTEEHRRLRASLAGLTTRGHGMLHREPGLKARLGGLVERLQAQWRAQVNLKMGDDVEFAMSPPLGDHLYHIVHEAATNALRHGNASTIGVDVFREDDTVHVLVTDDGRGFPWEGDRPHAALVAAGVGPRSLLDRTAALGGAVSIHSSDAGARVHLILPFAGRGA